MRTIRRFPVFIGLLAMAIAPLNSFSQDQASARTKTQSQGHHQSGVRGQSLWQSASVSPIWSPVWLAPLLLPDAAVILVYSQKGKLVAEVPTDENGNFEIFLKPGLYNLQVSHPNRIEIFPGILEGHATVTVQKKEFTSNIVLISMNRLWLGPPPIIIWPPPGIIIIPPPPPPPDIIIIRVPNPPPPPPPGSLLPPIEPQREDGSHLIEVKDLP